MLIEARQVGDQAGIPYDEFIVCAKVSAIFNSTAARASLWDVDRAIWLKAHLAIDEPIEYSMATYINHRRDICL